MMTEAKHRQAVGEGYQQMCMTEMNTHGINSKFCKNYDEREMERETERDRERKRHAKYALIWKRLFGFCKVDVWDGIKTLKTMD